MSIRVTALAVIMLWVAAGNAACAPLNGADPEAISGDGRQRDVITHEEILASPHRQVDLYQAIRGLRPHFLNAPVGNRTRMQPTAVYMDGVRQQNGLQTLSSIPASEVERVEYLDPTRAESQYGSTASGGAVVVTLTGQRRAPAAVRDTTAER